MGQNSNNIDICQKSMLGGVINQNFSARKILRQMEKDVNKINQKFYEEVRDTVIEKKFQLPDMYKEQELLQDQQKQKKHSKIYNQYQYMTYTQKHIFAKKQERELQKSLKKLKNRTIYDHFDQYSKRAQNTNKEQSQAKDAGEAQQKTDRNNIMDKFKTITQSNKVTQQESQLKSNRYYNNRSPPIEKKPLATSRSQSTIVPVIGQVNQNFRLPIVESIVSKKRANQLENQNQERQTAYISNTLKQRKDQMDNKNLKKKIFKELSFMQKINQLDIDITLYAALHKRSSQEKDEKDKELELFDKLLEEQDQQEETDEENQKKDTTEDDKDLKLKQSEKDQLQVLLAKQKLNKKRKQNDIAVIKQQKLDFNDQVNKIQDIARRESVLNSNVYSSSKKIFPKKQNKQSKLLFQDIFIKPKQQILQSIMKQNERSRSVIQERKIARQNYRIGQKTGIIGRKILESKQKAQKSDGKEVQQDQQIQKPRRGAIKLNNDQSNNSKNAIDIDDDEDSKNNKEQQKTINNLKLVNVLQPSIKPQSVNSKNKRLQPKMTL